MIEISLLSGELAFTALWLLSRGMIWIRQKKIVWKREAFLLLMYINIAVLIRFVFYPFFTVDGHVQPPGPAAEGDGKRTKRTGAGGRNPAQGDPVSQ